MAILIGRTLWLALVCELADWLVGCCSAQMTNNWRREIASCSSAPKTSHNEILHSSLADNKGHYLILGASSSHRNMWINWGSVFLFTTGWSLRSSFCSHPDTWPCSIQTQDGQLSLLLSLWIGLSLVTRRGLGEKLCPDCCHIGQFVKLKNVVAH